MAGASGKAMVTLYLIEKEGNYGWNVREGSYCFNTDTNTEGRAPALVDPAAYYGHGETDLAMMTLFGASIDPCSTHTTRSTRSNHTTATGKTSISFIT